MNFDSYTKNTDILDWADWAYTYYVGQEDEVYDLVIDWINSGVMPAVSDYLV